jgi:hypothetical protein
MRFQVTRRSVERHLLPELTIRAAPELFFTQAVIVVLEALDPALSAPPATTSAVASAARAPIVISRVALLAPVSGSEGSSSKRTPSIGTW